MEVLSPSTQSKDRGEKFLEYSGISSLTDYVIAAQNRVSVFHYTRLSERQWTVIEYTEMTDALTFAALNVTISLADIYRRVTFPTPQESEPI